MAAPILARPSLVLFLLVSAVRVASLGQEEAGSSPPAAEAPGAQAGAAPAAAQWERAEDRKRLVDGLVERGLKDPAVIAAMRKVPRHRFVPDAAASMAYVDSPLAIGYGQTISAPHMVAYMSELLALRPGSKVLEIGTGSGYQAAVLAELTDKVFSIEIVPELATISQDRLASLGYSSVRQKRADGYYGWNEEAPFDAMIVTAAADHIPPPLLQQLAPGGRMVIPVGGRGTVQTLLLVSKRMDGTIDRKAVASVLFVPMTGKVEE